MDEINIRVYKIFKDSQKEMYRNSVLIPAGESFPFDEFKNTFRMLYPNCLITFSFF